MPRVFLSWMVWLLLGVSWQNTPFALLPAGPCPAQSHTSPTFTRSQPHGSNWFLKDISSVSQKLGLQCARQSKQVHTLVRVLALSLPQQESARHLQSTLVLGFFPALVFFPRKLSPPTAAADPYLS
jgi:hypothetical protein